MDISLLAQAAFRLLLGALLTGLCLFIPAGTLAYWNAWLLLALLLVPACIAGAVLLMRKPDLLRKRMRMRETERGQRAVVAISGVMFILGFIVSGLNRRFLWLQLPRWVCLAASAMFILGYLLYAEVLRENAYLSRSVEIQAGQRVVDTGLYGVVRHPMYTATLLLFLSMPLILGSPQALAVFLIYPPLLAGRIANEERVLEEGLPGYAQYKSRVRYRLIPFLW